MKCTIWIHDHEFIHEFMIMNLYMNWWLWIHVWIHNMNSCMNLWPWIILWNHVRIYMYILMNNLWIHAFEFMIMKSYMNSSYAITHSCVNSVLWRILWNHGRIPLNKFTPEIMVEFINLKLIWIQIQICLVRENGLLIQSNHRPFFVGSSLLALRLA